MPRYNRSTCILIFLMLFGTARIAAQKKETAGKDNGLITIWYGAEQKFGHRGQPQRWINVLGNITDPDAVDSVMFSVNERPEHWLSLGSDLHRLALPGDFNVELSWDEVEKGTNLLRLTAYNKNSRPVWKEVRLIVEKENTWPMPYYVDFSATENIQDVVQVVDGLWKSEDSGVRTVQRYYDRVLTMGDIIWENYETTIRLTIHDFTPSEPGPPTYNVTHFGVAMRWRGHQQDGRQPGRKWYPLGAQGEFLLRDNPDSCQWRILFDGSLDKPPRYADKYNRYEPDQSMLIKTQVATLPDGRSRYRFKQWNEGMPEPINWDVEGCEAGDYPSGALCLVPHNSDVTIHEVRVEPLIID